MISMSRRLVRKRNCRSAGSPNAFSGRMPALSAGGAASCRPAAGSILRMLRPPDRGPGFAQILQMAEQLIDIQAYGPAAGKGDQQIAAIEAQRQQGQNAVGRGLFQPLAL